MFNQSASELRMMKKFLCFVSFAVLVVFSFVIVSCSNDDDDIIDGGNMRIIGTWKCDLSDRANVQGYGVKDFHLYYYSQFKEDGTYVDVSVKFIKYSEILKDSYPELEQTTVDFISRGTYKVKGNRIIETTNGNSGSATIEVSENTLIQTNKIGETWIFNKVNDTEIDEYLTMEPLWK